MGKIFDVHIESIKAKKDEKKMKRRCELTVYMSPLSESN